MEHVKGYKPVATTDLLCSENSEELERVPRVEKFESPRRDGFEDVSSMVIFEVPSIKCSCGDAFQMF